MAATEFGVKHPLLLPAAMKENELRKRWTGYPTTSAKVPLNQEAFVLNSRNSNIGADADTAACIIAAAVHGFYPIFCKESVFHEPIGAYRSLRCRENFRGTLCRLLPTLIKLVL